MLSRLLISGPLDNLTPLCVLNEIADAHGLKYINLDTFNNLNIVKINTTNLTDTTNLSVNAWKHIVRFVNKYERWTPNLLAKAFNYLFSFNDDSDPLPKIDPNFTVIQKVNQVRSVNATILYKVCKYHQIALNYHTTLDQLTQYVRLLFLSRANLLNRAELSLANKSNAELITFISDVNFTNNINYDSLNNLQIQLSNVNFLRTQLRPISAESCVALAFLNYHLDISTTTNPILEYYNLLADEYVFLDPKLRLYQSLNPNLYNINCNFNPLFSINYYTKDQLRILALNEGYSKQDLNQNNAYDLLQVSYLTENFYLGPHPKITDRITSIDLDEVSEVNNGELLGYGIVSNNLKPITIEELINLFEANRNFSSPFNSEDVFHSTVINKLKVLLTNSGYSERTMALRQRLLSLIRRLEITNNVQSDSVSVLVNSFNNGDMKLKESIHYTLICFLEMGMNMRGWKIGSYITDSIPCDELQVNINVRMGIEKYESSCKSLGRLGLTIQNLPLLRYRNGVYQKSTDANEGFTIGERLNIVKKNEKSNINCCIRISSNWFCSTAHKYLILLGFPAPFDINKLRHIL